MSKLEDTMRRLRQEHLGIKPEPQPIPEAPATDTDIEHLRAIWGRLLIIWRWQGRAACKSCIKHCDQRTARQRHTENFPCFRPKPTQLERGIELLRRLGLLTEKPNQNKTV